MYPAMRSLYCSTVSFMIRLSFQRILQETPPLPTPSPIPTAPRTHGHFGISSATGTRRVRLHARPLRATSPSQGNLTPSTNPSHHRIAQFRHALPRSLSTHSNPPSQFWKLPALPIQRPSPDLLHYTFSPNEGL